LSCSRICFSPIRAPLCLTLFPYTTLFRSSSDAASRFVTNLDAGFLGEPADHTDHGQGGDEVGVDLFLAGRGLDEIGTGHHADERDRKSTRLNSSHVKISYAVFALKKKTTN